jgi:hypothetical protein
VVLGSVTGAALRLEVVAQVTLHWAYNVEAAACWIRLSVAGVFKKGKNQQNAYVTLSSLLDMDLKGRRLR